MEPKNRKLNIYLFFLLFTTDLSLRFRLVSVGIVFFLNRSVVNFLHKTNRKIETGFRMPLSLKEMIFRFQKPGNRYYRMRTWHWLWLSNDRWLKRTWELDVKILEIKSQNWSIQIWSVIWWFHRRPAVSTGRVLSNCD